MMTVNGQKKAVTDLKRPCGFHRPLRSLIPAVQFSLFLRFSRAFQIMTGKLYVTFRKTGKQRTPIGIETSSRRAEELYRSEQIDGYLVSDTIVEKADDQKVLHLHLGTLDWPKVTGTRALDAFTGYRPQPLETVGEVVRFMEEHARDKRSLRMRNYGAKTHEATRKVFQKLGVVLPEVKLG